MAKKKTTTESAPQPSAGYTVLARRYRPQQFDELVGQEAVAQALVNAIESGRVAHAYLFTGARGVGKTSAARILAKAINCEKGPTAKPCDRCEICQAITSGEDTDVLEIDGASNNSVDNIRELRQNVQFRPSRSRCKIYIIDEVHMLSTSAFNALLKTLEEPPPHVKFIFATTEVHKVPVTILSRCQRFDFGGITTARIFDRLKEIVLAEKMQANQEALEIIARRAGGSMRDAQSLLDQLLAFSGDKLTVDSVHKLLGTTHEDRVIEMADAVLSKDARKALAILNELVNQGQQLGELLDQLLEYWRDLMVVQSAGLAGQAVSVSSAKTQALEQHAKRMNLETILAGLDILTAAKSRMRNSSHTRALIEMACVRLCQLEDLLPISQLVEMLSREPRGGPNVAPATRFVPSASPIAQEKKKLEAESAGEISRTSIPLNEDSLPAILSQLLTESGFASQAELRKATSHAISGPNSLVFHVPRRYNTPASLFLDQTRARAVVETLGKIVGQACSIRVEWVDDPVETASSSTTQAHGPQRQMRAELTRIPLVKKASEILGAQVIRADEGFGTAVTRPVETESEGPPDEG